MQESTEYLSLSQAANHFKINRKAVSTTTVFRWMRDGVRRGDRVIQLRFTFLGRRMVTCDQWISEFISSMEAAAREAQPTVKHFEPKATPSKRTEAQRQKALQQANAELVKAGL